AGPGSWRRLPGSRRAEPAYSSQPPSSSDFEDPCSRGARWKMDPRVRPEEDGVGCEDVKEPQHRDAGFPRRASGNEKSPPKRALASRRARPEARGSSALAGLVALVD